MLRVLVYNQILKIDKTCFLCADKIEELSDLDCAISSEFLSILWARVEQLWHQKDFWVYYSGIDQSFGFFPRNCKNIFWNQNKFNFGICFTVIFNLRQNTHFFIFYAKNSIFNSENSNNKDITNLTLLFCEMYGNS